jgi:biotin carboxyl carrier protein
MSRPALPAAIRPWDAAAATCDTVKAGQPLLLLDDRDARLRLDQARASLERAEADAQHAKTDASRSRELFEKGFTTKSDYERLVNQDTGAAAAVAQARAQLASAQKAVDDATVRAPFAGHVTARPVAAGEYVTPAAKVATIVRIQPIKLELLVKEVDAVKVRRGLPVQAEVSGYPGVLFAGSVSALNVAIDPNSRAMTIEALFPNADARVTPGCSARPRSGCPPPRRRCSSPPGDSEDRQRRRILRDRGNRAQLRSCSSAKRRVVRIDAGLRASRRTTWTNSPTARPCVGRAGPDRRQLARVTAANSLNFVRPVFATILVLSLTVVSAAFGWAWRCESTSRR